MTRVKYLVIILALLTGFIISGELYQLYSDDFCDFYTTTVRYDKAVNDKDAMLADIAECCEQNNVKIFLYVDSVLNKFNREITIYCDENTKDYLINQTHLYSGKNKSIFSGNTTFEFCPFENAPEELIENERNHYYLIGDLSDMKSMSSQLSAEYEVGELYEDGYSEYDTVVSALAVFWCIIVIIICFVSYCALNNSQREYVVRASMGEPLGLIYLKIIGIDSAVIVVFSLLFVVILSAFSTPMFMLPISVAAIVICIILNALINLRIFGFKIRAAFQNAAGKLEILIVNYFVKIITCILATTFLVTEFSVVNECLDFYKQEEFFKAHSDYQYIDLYKYFKSGDSKPTDNINEVSEQIYRTYYKDMFYMDPLFSAEDNDIYFTSDTSLYWLRQWIPELNDADFSQNISILIPSDNKLSDIIINDILDFAGGCFTSDVTPTTRTMYYNEGSVIAIDDSLLNNSSWTDAPIIVVISGQQLEPLRKEDVLQGNVADSIFIPVYYNCMIRSEPEALQSFIEDYGYDVKITNAYSYYLYRKSVIERTLYLCSILIILVVLLEISVNVLIIKTEYKFNAVELAVKKVLGYTRFQRYKTILIATVISILIAIILSGVILFVLGQFSAVALLISLVLIIFIEIATIRRCSKKYEKESVNKIFKGGI